MILRLLERQSNPQETTRRSPRYLANIENKGQHPSLQIFFELVTRYHISVDQLLFEDATESKSTTRRQLDPLLDGMTEAELKIVIATAPAIAFMVAKGRSFGLLRYGERNDSKHSK